MRFIFIVALLTSVPALGIEYFDSGIDYWGNNPKQKKVVQKGKRVTKKEKKKGFDWKKQLNAQDDEFFREGNYLPPKAFMELVRNPNETNIKNWFRLIEKKNALSKRLSIKIEEYLIKEGKKLKPQGKQWLSQKAKSLSPPHQDYKKLRFRMYFDSKCPHCKRMMKTMEELSAMGFFVELRQVDRDQKGLEGISFPITFASKNELHAKDIKSVPVLFVGDLNQKTVYRLTGYQTVSGIFNAINQKKGLIKNQSP